MPAVDILNADGTWLRNRSEANDVAGFIGGGADIFVDGIKYPLMNRAGSMYNPDIIWVVVGNSQIPLRQFLSSSSVQSQATSASTIVPQTPASESTPVAVASMIPQQTPSVKLVQSTGISMVQKLPAISINGKPIYRMMLQTPEGKIGTSATYPACTRTNPEGCLGMEFDSIGEAVAYGKSLNETMVMIDLPYDQGVDEAWRIAAGGELNPPKSYLYSESSNMGILALAAIGALLLWKKTRR